MDLGNIYTKQEIFMKDSKLMKLKAVKENTFGSMVISMKENFTMTKDMEKVSIQYRAITFTKGIL